MCNYKIYKPFLINVRLGREASKNMEFSICQWLTKKSQIIVLSFFHCIKIKICIVRLFLHCRSSKQRKLIVAQQHHFVAPRKTENVITSLLITILIVYFLFTIPVIVHDLASQFIGKFFFCFLFCNELEFRDQPKHGIKHKRIRGE